MNKNKEKTILEIKEIDVRGLSCPLPILHVKRALLNMYSGQILRIITNDPSTQHDFHAFAQRTGNKIIDFFVEKRDFIFLVKKR